MRSLRLQDTLILCPNEMSPGVLGLAFGFKEPNQGLTYELLSVIV